MELESTRGKVSEAKTLRQEDLSVVLFVQAVYFHMGNLEPPKMLLYENKL